MFNPDLNNEEGLQEQIEDNDSEDEGIEDYKIGG